jgi:hypothetical protein
VGLKALIELVVDPSCCINNTSVMLGLALETGNVMSKMKALLTLVHDMVT